LIGGDQVRHDVIVMHVPAKFADVDAPLVPI
jgi:hypothetical protein